MKKKRNGLEGVMIDNPRAGEQVTQRGNAGVNC